jgi:ubiquinone/menaquinone biosynthesis C-methylase UbiE
MRNCFSPCSETTRFAVPHHVVTGLEGFSPCVAEAFHMMGVKGLENLDIFVDFARSMMKQDIVIAPWLTWGDGQHRFSSHQLQEMDAAATRFADQHWCSDWQITLGESYPIAKHRVVEAFHETVSSTAVYLSHLELGRLTVTEEMVRVAERLTENFVAQFGPQPFVKFYILTIIYENLQALQYYGSMHVDDFLKGHFHRPWGTETLSTELQFAITSGAVEIDNDTGRMQLTSSGKELLSSLERMFTESGFLKFRSRLIRLNNFNHLDDVASMMEILFPNASEARKMVVELSGIQPGMAVLELGCGTGALTFEAGLFQAVGPNGRLVATDPSTSMLASVRRKRETYNAHWVEVVHAKAERLPFPANTFDSVIGCAFLHLTNIDEALREIARVLKPGGSFITMHPLHFPAQNEFFLEWFAPMLQTGGTPKSQDNLPGPDTVPSAMKPFFEIEHIQRLDGEVHYTSPRTVVEFFVGIANVFEEQMATLPWRARQDMMEQLIKRGEDICRKYPPESLVETHPGQFIRAIVRK